MKKFYFLVVLLIALNTAQAQYTELPDVNFEQALIDQGLDDVIDGLVLTSNLSTVTYLDVSSRGILDLRGIEDFQALKFLDADDNDLTELNLQNNLNLEVLWGDRNMLTDIDLSNNVELRILTLENNQLQEIDLSNNTQLEYLWIEKNNLSQLDVQHNTLLKELLCGNNEFLTFINLQNGNNRNLESLEAIGIFPNSCIQVDDVKAVKVNGNYPYNQWKLDDTTLIVEDCSTTMSTYNTELISVQFYPNPATNVIYLQNFTTSSYKIYDIKGSVVETASGLSTNQIDVAHLKAGTYFLNLTNESDFVHTIKFIKN